MTDHLIPRLRATIDEWRERAAGNGAIYASGIEECVDDLSALLAAHEAGQGVELISRATLERHLDYLRKAMRDMLHLESDAPDEDIIDIAAGRLAAHEAATPVADTIEVIVNGQPVIVKSGTVRDVISQAVRLSGQIGAPAAQWELRTTEGDVIPHGLCDGTDYELTPGRRLWLNLGLPVPPVAAEAAPVERPEQEALRQIGIMAMLAQSDPHATAEAYRKSLIDICNYALKAQPALPPSTERTP